MKLEDRDPAAVLEDLEFLASVGVGTTEAAQRTGFPSANSLEKWLAPDRHNRMDVWRSLRAHDPISVTNPADARWPNHPRRAA